MANNEAPYPYRKLGFLWRILHPKKKSIYVEVFELLRQKDIEPLIIQQCKFLEKIYGTHFTDTLLSQCGDDITLKTVKKVLARKDREYIWKQVSSRKSLTALTRDINLLKLWDEARNYDLSGVRALEATLRTLSIPVFGELSCHICSHKYNSSRLQTEHYS